MLTRILATLSPFAFASLVIAVPPPADFDTGRLLNAIRTVETGGHPDPANAVGDKGKAIGPYQIHRAYWQDAVEYDPSIGGTYADCKDHRYARRIVIAYLSRYCKKWDYETPARIHNGGPKGHTKTATVKYWNKVKNNL
ncbi:MAG: hypothetical protein ACO3QV_07060 [Candidatus Nanopelagicaceae bacterium]|jgi:hypothetical protein